MVCIPDLNKDGIDGNAKLFSTFIYSSRKKQSLLDLAISAPGEKDDIHTGSVYIYLGSRTSNLQKYTQKIVPSQLLNNLKETKAINDFGFSLATQSPFSHSNTSSSSSEITTSNSTITIDYPSLIIGIPKADMIVSLR